VKPHEKEILTHQLLNHGECVVKVGGRCMNPTIQPLSKITIAQLDESDIRCGEVFAYFLGTQLFLHRLVERSGPNLLFCADSGVTGVHQLSAHQLFGKIKKIQTPSLLQQGSLFIKQLRDFLNSLQAARLLPT